ncbi:uncharacterized protein LOC117341173 [Pecten maximus]|uniref:uncharacterized protein LOC117341173 n=1 Tax=Pecten maximus TaxID=6579 RepID=UPI001458AFEE|nr:uncharacterized protein LOC117341173 [Pecten maximus]
MACSPTQQESQTSQRSQRSQGPHESLGSDLRVDAHITSSPPLSSLTASKNSCEICGAAPLRDQHSCRVCDKVLCVCCSEMHEKLLFMRNDSKESKGDNCWLCDRLHILIFPDSGENSSPVDEEVSILNQNHDDLEQSTAGLPPVLDKMTISKGADNPISSGASSSHINKVDMTIIDSSKSNGGNSQGDHQGTRPNRVKIDERGTMTQGHQQETIFTKGQGHNQIYQDIRNTGSERKETLGNLSPGLTYSFISQLFSPRQRTDYAHKINFISKWNNRDQKQFGDVLLLSSDKNEDIRGAEKYCEYLNTLQMRGGPEQPGIFVKARLYHQLVLPGSPVISGFVEALEQFTFVFLYETKSLEALHSYFKEICLSQQVIIKEKNGCLAVVYAEGVDPSSVDNQLWLHPLMSVSATDRSKDTERALIKKLESKLYMREAKEKDFIEEHFKEAQRKEKAQRLKEAQNLDETA